MSVPSDLLIRDQHPLSLIESTDPGGDGVFNEDGTVNVALIRPCDGRGPGARIYTAPVLEALAPTCAGWASYMNHDDPKARRAAAKMRRGPDELAGELRETRWDPAYTTPEDAKFGYEPGAVVGRYMPATPLVEELIRRVPGQLKLSIKAQATGLKPQRRKDGKPGMLVEGIENDPENSSFDLVTAAGAGGHVRSLVESLYDPANATEGLSILEGVEDEELVAWLREHRPALLEPEGGADSMNLQEALASDEVTAYLGQRIDEGIAARLPDLLSARETELRESIRSELGREHRTRGLHIEALRLIEATKLPRAAKDDLRDRYGLLEAEDGTVVAGDSLALLEAAMDAEDKADGGSDEASEGKGFCVKCKKKMAPTAAGNCPTCGTTIAKTAKGALKESIAADERRIRNMLRESAPSVPSAPGAGADSHVSTGQRFGGQGSRFAEHIAAKGLKPEQFGIQPATTTEK